MLQDSHSTTDFAFADGHPSSPLPGASGASPSQSPISTPAPALPSCTHSVRRANLLALLLSYSQESLKAGQSAKGIEQAFAAHLQISPSMLSQIKRSRNISDPLATQIERLSGKEDGWLSRHRPSSDAKPRQSEQSAISEDVLVDMVREKWRTASAEERQQITKIFQKS